MYDQTKSSSKSDTVALRAALLAEDSLGNIDWAQTTWEDLRKPLYSALAAMLYTFDQVFSNLGLFFCVFDEQNAVVPNNILNQDPCTRMVLQRKNETKNH